MSSPKVTVLMPVYNGDKYLREAMESILNQTFFDFEFLIINDGSTDHSVSIIESYRDSRIRLIHNECNIGLVHTLNKGLEQAQGEFIARMDCDDISLPDRLANQVDYMENHPEVGVCGGWIIEMNPNYRIIYPTEHDEIKIALLWICPFAHPTVMFRTQVIRENHLQYDPSFQHAEDYEFWVRLSTITHLANIAEVVLLYHSAEEGISKTHALTQRQVAERVRLIQVKQLIPDASDNEYQLHLDFVTGKPMEFGQEKMLDAWLRKLLIVNAEKNYYDQQLFEQILRGYRNRTAFISEINDVPH